MDVVGMAEKKSKPRSLRLAMMKSPALVIGGD